MFLKYNLYSILWAIIILVLSLLPPSQFPEKKLFEGFDKIAHAFFYAQLTVLLIFGFKKQYSFKKLQQNALNIALTFGLLYGILIEVLQGTIFVYRTFDLYDILANGLGCMLGLAITQSKTFKGMIS